MSLSGIDSPELSQVNADFAPDESGILEKQQQSDFLDSLMVSKDKDSNGVLTLDESGLSKKEFSKFDADGNNMVTPAEMQAVLEKLHKEKGEFGKLVVEMQQAAESSAESPNADSKNVVGFETGGLDEVASNMLDSDEDDKVSNDAADLLKTEDQGEGGNGVFSEALSEFQKNFFRKEEDEEEKDLDKDGVVSPEEEEQAQQKAAQITGVNSKENEKNATDSEPQGRSFTARRMAGLRAYQNQASEFFATAAQATVNFQY